MNCCSRCWNCSLGYFLYFDEFSVDKCFVVLISSLPPMACRLLLVRTLLGGIIDLEVKLGDSWGGSRFCSFFVL